MTNTPNIRTEEKDPGSCPQWQMSDAYEEIGAPRYEAAKKELEELCTSLKRAVSALPHTITRDAVSRLSHALACYEQSYEVLTSLQAFLKCLGAKDATRADVGVEQATLNHKGLTLEALAKPLFERLQKASTESSEWALCLEDATIRAWQGEVSRRASYWEQQLPIERREIFNALKEGPLSALSDVHKSLQRLVTLTVHDQSGESQSVVAAKLVTILKGHPDATLRHETARAMEAFYQQHGEVWAKALNTLHGIRLPFLRDAHTTPQRVSLWQNRMSEVALTTMVEAIQSHREVITQAVSARAQVFGVNALPYEDLLAPCPSTVLGQVSGEAPIPFDDAITLITEALSRVSPEMGDFPRLMLERGWMDAAPDAKKIGGAFYTRFNALKMPRVFSSYTGSLSSVLQQAHELGHAFHYWVLRDLPTIETEFPMTLTETASTFNEALVRETLRDRASEKERFAMLWQDMRSAGNFLLHTMVRWDFERHLLEELPTHYVSAERMNTLMAESWQRWFGDSATVDTYLWAYKLHFYKTDQWLYNYPYTVGYLMSAALMETYQERQEAFYPFYRAFLRDTGRLSVDDMIERHFGLSLEAFWDKGLQRVIRQIHEFTQYFDQEGHEQWPLDLVD